MGCSIRKTAKKLNKGTSTVQRVKRLLNKNNL
jgi:transposase